MYFPLFLIYDSHFFNIVYYYGDTFKFLRIIRIVKYDGTLVSFHYLALYFKFTRPLLV